MNSVKIHFASSGVHNKEVMAKEKKVRELVHSGEGNGCEQNSSSILSSASVVRMLARISNAEKWFIQREMTATILLSHLFSRHKPCQWKLIIAVLFCKVPFHFSWVWDQPGNCPFVRRSLSGKRLCSFFWVFHYLCFCEHGYIVLFFNKNSRTTAFKDCSHLLQEVWHCLYLEPWSCFVSTSHPLSPLKPALIHFFS